MKKEKEVYITRMSYEEARQKGLVGELEIKLKVAVGEDSHSVANAYVDLKRKVKGLGATHIFSREARTLGPKWSPSYKVIVYGDAYGPKLRNLQKVGG